MRWIKHFLEVIAVEQIILTYQHLQIINQYLYWKCFSPAKVLMLTCPNDLFPWLFDLHQDGEDKEEEHHPCGHADDCPMSLCDVVKETFTPFLWTINVIHGRKRKIKETFRDSAPLHQDTRNPSSNYSKPSLKAKGHD